jgi:uncharacterized damage-inducible protein DinB
MITPAYTRTMAVYNAEMNRRLYNAAARLSDAERKRDRGAFWGSIHGSLNHILWGDGMWMARFANWPKPALPIKESARLYEDFAALRVAREAADRKIAEWTGRLDDKWLSGELTWWSGAAEREVRAPIAFLVAHMFNHQTHHRGQVHAMLTAAGEKTGDTDLFLVVPGIVS